MRHFGRRIQVRCFPRGKEPGRQVHLSLEGAGIESRICMELEIDRRCLQFTAPCSLDSARPLPFPQLETPSLSQNVTSFELFWTGAYVQALRK